MVSAHSLITTATTTRASSAGSRPSSGLAAAVEQLSSVDLQRLDQAQLHDRVESKVILRSANVPAALSRLADDYHVLEHDGERLQGYRTQYFDSHALRSYHDHHNKKRRRLKVRYRTYVNSDLTYFEVKRNVDGRTVKERRMSHVPYNELWLDDADFLSVRTGWDAGDLAPSLMVSYDRILLVKKDFGERVTIDLNISFVSSTGATHAPELSICEFKQPKLDRRSPAMTAMRRRPQKFSKYCMGLASCDPSLRRNRFKKVFRTLEGLEAMPTPAEVAA